MTGDGQFTGLQSVAIDSSDNAYAADAGNDSNPSIFPKLPVNDLTSKYCCPYQMVRILPLL